MGKYKIYDKSGARVKAETKRLEYSGEYLGKRVVTCDVYSPTPLDLNVGDYLDYRGERFTLNYAPSVYKKSGAGMRSDAFEYKDMVFDSVAMELSLCDFLDVVKADNHVHYTALPTFSFYATPKDLAERIEANLDRLYKGDRKWTVTVHPDSPKAEGKPISVNRMSVWESIGLFDSKFKLRIDIAGRNITVGAPAKSAGRMFRYGKGNGLRGLRFNSNQNDKIVTRLRVYGSSENLPHRYYHRILNSRIRTKITQVAYSVDAGGAFTGAGIDLDVENFGKYLWSHRPDYEGKGYRIGLETAGIAYKGVFMPDTSATDVKAGEEAASFGGIILVNGTDAEMRAFTPGAEVILTSGVNEFLFPESRRMNEGVTILPNNMSVTNLMLPGFPENPDPYIDSEHIGEYGVREGSVFFDGSGEDTESIHPTIKGMTAEQLKASGINVELEEGDNGHLDEIYDAEQVEDDGYQEDNYLKESIGKITADQTTEHKFPKNEVKDKPLTDFILLNENLQEGSYVLVPEKNFTISFKETKVEGYLRIRLCVYGGEQLIGKSSDMEVKPGNDGSYITTPGRVAFDTSGDATRVSIRVEADGKNATVNFHLKGDMSYGRNLSQLFKIRLKDIGFNINDFLSGEAATISMTGGECSGREFEIVGGKQKPVKSGKQWVLTCKRTKDESIGLLYPYKHYNIKKGDTFVLLHIAMPSVYVKAASEKLLEAGKKYLKEIDHPKDVFEPEIDNLEMARQHEKAKQSGEVSLYETLREGQMFDFGDYDLRDGKVTIDRLTIAEESGKVPKYTVTLKDEKEERTIQKLQNQLSAGVGGAHGGGKVNYSELMRMFLSKQGEDRTDYLLRLMGGAVTDELTSSAYSNGMAGYGFKLWNKDGKSGMELDELTVRVKALFAKLEIKKLTYAGGNWVFSPAGMTCSRVDEYDTHYRCYFTADDGEKQVENEFAVGDQVRNWEFNVKAGVHEGVSNRHYWRKCVATGTDYIDLSKTDCHAGSDAPQAGDSLATIGNDRDVSRQHAIIVSAYGESAPSLTLYEGIDSYNLTGKDVIVISPKGSKFKGDIYLKTGELLISVVENMLKTEMGKMEYFFDQANNLLTGSIFPEGTDKWAVMGKALLAMGGKPLRVNGLTTNGVGHWPVETYMGEQSLHLTAGGIVQRNGYIRKKGKQYYVRVRYGCTKPGTLVVGFTGGGRATEASVQTDGYKLATFPIAWDGNGDFYLSHSGEIYLSYILLTDKDSTEVTFLSKVEQLANRITLSVTKNDVIASINLSGEGVKIKGRNIELEGTTTFNGNTRIDEDGNLHSRNGYFEGEVRATSGYFEGEIHATSGTFDGEIKARSGRFIGGIGNPYLKRNIGSVDGDFIPGTIETGMNTFISTDEEAQKGMLLPSNKEFDGLECEVMNLSNGEAKIAVQFGGMPGEANVPKLYYRSKPIQEIVLKGGCCRARLKCFLKPGTIGEQCSWTVMNTGDFQLNHKGNGYYDITSKTE